MTLAAPTWSATVTVRIRDPRLADRLERSLRPEAEREVPRGRGELTRPSPDSIELAIAARDSGAMRAALNTYLGWVHLSLATARAAMVASPGNEHIRD
jgi:tRNA threonylcarbamoyladenosine modification (KEOPS) complex  Pcc1 subunit